MQSLRALCRASIELYAELRAELRVGV